MTPLAYARGSSTKQTPEQDYPALAFINFVYGENGGGLLRLKAPGSERLTLPGAGLPSGGGVWRCVAGSQPAKPKTATIAAKT